MRFAERVQSALLPALRERALQGTWQASLDQRGLPRTVGQPALPAYPPGVREGIVAERLLLSRTPLRKRPQRGDTGTRSRGRFGKWLFVWFPL